jgi:hypothetical protein
MGYWAGLFLELDKEALEAGVKMMLQIATKLLREKTQDGRLLLKNNPDDSTHG